MINSRKIIKLILICGTLIVSSNVLAFGLKDVFKNLHINNTSPGNYQDAAAGWYSGGSSVMRTKNTSFQPFSMTAPSLTTGCNGIDAFTGSFSMMSGTELVKIAENLGSQTAVYGFHLGLKTYAPQIEQVLKDLRNLQMELNQFGIGHCKATQAAFAAALPKNTAIYETVCGEMAEGSGLDLWGQRQKCRNHQSQKEAVKKAQQKDPDMLLDNFNLFVKVATKAGIPQEMHALLMSMTGTIVVKDGIYTPYPSLASDTQSWNVHINGGEGATRYSCDDQACLNITVNNNISITAENSYSGLAKAKLNDLKIKMRAQAGEFSAAEKGFLDSIGTSFPIFDHITIEAASGISILDSSGQVVARSMLLEHLTSTTSEIKKGVVAFKNNKQISDQYLREYEKSLDRLLQFASSQWNAVMTDADRINDRAEKIEKHLIARERG